MSVIQPPPPHTSHPHTPTDNGARSAARSARTSALLATAILLVICVGLSRLFLGVGSAGDALSAGFFALVFGLLGALISILVVWITASVLRVLQSSPQHRSASSAQDARSTAERSDSLGLLAGVICLLPLAVLCFVAMIAASPPLWMILAAGLLIALSAGAGALWAKRPQAPLQRIMPRTKAKR